MFFWWHQIFNHKIFITNLTKLFHLVTKMKKHKETISLHQNVLEWARNSLNKITSQTSHCNIFVCILTILCTSNFNLAEPLHCVHINTCKFIALNNSRSVVLFRIKVHSTWFPHQRHTKVFKVGNAYVWSSHHRSLG